MGPGHRGRRHHAAAALGHAAERRGHRKSQKTQQQGHHAADVELLKKLLHAKTPEARAAATRVLSDEWERIPGALALMKAQVTDDFARTRCEAVRALSFIQTKEAVETFLLVADKPRDYWLDYTLNATLSALEGVWKLLFKNNALPATPAGLELLSEMENAGKPSGAAVTALKTFLAAPGMAEMERRRHRIRPHH